MILPITLLMAVCITLLPMTLQTHDATYTHNHDEPTNDPTHDTTHQPT